MRGTLLLVGMVLAAGMAQAETCTWIGGNGDWFAEDGWKGGRMPEAGDDVVLAGTTGATLNLQGRETVPLASLAFGDATGGDWALTNGTLRIADNGAVFTNSKWVTVKISAVIAGAGDLVKRGDGTLALSGANTFTGRLVIEGGRLQPETDAALGPVPAAYRADAIVLRGGILGSSSDVNTTATTTIVPTRGMTLEGAGELGPRSGNILCVQAPIVGTGDLRLSLQMGRVRLEAANGYTGRTVLGYKGSYWAGAQCRLEVTADGALPETTQLEVANTSATASISLNATTQRVAAVSVGATAKLMLYGNDAGAGLLRFGTAADESLAVTNVYLTADATFAYAGAGTITPNLATAVGTTFALEGGRLALPSSAALGACTLALGAGTTVALAEGVTNLVNDLVTAGGKIVTTEPTLTLCGNLGRTAAEAGLTVTSETAVTFGAADAVLRTFGAPIAVPDGRAVTLAGWVEAGIDPAAYARTADCVVFGPYAGVAPGDLALDAETRGILSPDELGPGGGKVALANGSRLVLCATNDVAATSALTLDATSVLELGGTGMVDLTGATWSGAGTVRLSGGRVRLKGNLGALALVGTGDVDVPDGETLTVARAAGPFRKTGRGTLVFTGSEDAAMRTLTVAEGTVRLAFTGGAKLVGNITVAAGATLVLDGDEQINGANVVFLEGTFDLNGHTVSLARYHNTPAADSPRSSSTAALVNRAQATATLTVAGETAFFGRIAEEPGRIEIIQTRGLFNPFGPAESAAPSVVRATGDGVVFPYTRWASFRFVFRKTLKEGKPVQLSEIQLTCQGKPLPVSAVKGVASNGTVPANPIVNLCDDRADTYWQTTLASNAYVDLWLDGFPAVDGYRLGANEVANAPTDWDVYGFRADPSGWFLLDSRRGERIVRANPEWTTFNRTMSTNYLFTAAGRPRAPLVPTTAVELAGPTDFARMRVSSQDPMRVGAVSGTGGISIEDGSAFAPADLTDWTGTFTFPRCGRLGSPARILLSSERGGPAAQPVRVTATNAHVSIENAGTQPVSVLVDDAAPQPLRGRLADGKGPLGLVKRGTGTYTLATADSANTGPTAVEAGTLRVCGPLGVGRLPVSARYLRIWPKKNSGGGGYDGSNAGFNWGMNDFQLLDADGARIAFPEGTAVTAENGFLQTSPGAALVDGDVTTRCLVANTAQEAVDKTGACAWVVIDMQTAVSFSGYRWYTPHGNMADQDRVPVEWTLETSDDGADWTTVDTASDPYTLAYGNANDKTGFQRGPYALRGTSDGVLSFVTLPAAFLAGATARTTRAPALKARYFRFQPHETYDPTHSNFSYGWMVSEFALFRNGERLDWPEGTTPSLFGGELNTNNGSALEKICNNATSGGLDLATLERVFVTQMPSFVILDAGEGNELTFDAYGFYAAASGGRDERIPTAWTFSVSEDGKTWHVVDEQVGQREIVKTDYALQGPWSVAGRYPLLAAASATDALGDASPVALSAGATLVLDSDYERFGTLSGAGTLRLCNGAVGEVNLCRNGVFTGTVTGKGTLAVCGVATQTLDGATLDVARLELNGGTVAGTASRSGDVALAFNGGVWMGSLSVAGAFTAAGTPVFALPETVPDGFRQTLFAYGSLSEETAACLAAAEVRGEVPEDLKVKVRVDAKRCVLSVAADGTVLFFR